MMRTRIFSSSNISSTDANNFPTVNLLQRVLDGNDKSGQILKLICIRTNRNDGDLSATQILLVCETMVHC